MKTYIHHFRGTNGVPSHCQVYIKEMGTSTWVGFANGDGLSVTNASEQLASEIAFKENLDPKMTKFFEWYPEYEPRVDEINYTWKGSEASNPQWKHFCDVEENPFHE